MPLLWTNPSPKYSNHYFNSNRDIGEIPTLVPIPLRFLIKLQGFLSIDEQFHSGVRSFPRGAGEDDVWGQGPGMVFPVDLEFEVALNLGPVPARFGDHVA